MNHPREILRRAQHQKGQPEPVQSLPGVRSAVPVIPQSQAAEKPVQSVPERVMVPKPIRSDSVYRQLMASHDRMNQRHLKG